MTSVAASDAAVRLRIVTKQLAEKRNEFLEVEYGISRLRLELGRLEERQPMLARAVYQLTDTVADLTAVIEDDERGSDSA